MKKILFTLVCLPLLVATVVPNETLQPKIDTPTYKIMEMAYLWDLLNKNYEPDRERDGTWLLEGLRSKYAAAKKYAKLDRIETAFDCSVFVKGPHQNDMNFNSHTSFGHYNPKFVEKLNRGVQMALEVPTFKQVLQYAYQQNFRSLALTYRDAYRYLQEEPEMAAQIREDYLAMIAAPGGTTEGSLQEVFRDYADSVERNAAASNNPEADWYEAVTAPSFWIRRSIDGTAESWFVLLEMIISEMEER